jgi:chromosome transmission fidelity protein 1
MSSVLYWLMHFYPLQPKSEEKCREANKAAKDDIISSTPSWVFTHSNASVKQTQQAQSIEKLRHRVMAYKSQQKADKSRSLNQTKRKMPPTSQSTSDSDSIKEDSELIIDWKDPEASEEGENANEPEWRRILSAGNKSLSELFVRSMSEHEAILATEDLPQVNPQFIFTSRTHSQLIQFVEELREKMIQYKGKLRVVSLASRAKLCINEAVRKYKTPSRINDQCLELQKKKDNNKQIKSSPASSFIVNNNIEAQKEARSQQGCPYLPSAYEIRDFALDSILTTADLEELGAERHSCPYYGVRQSLSSAHVLVVPYQMLLHKATRESLGINLFNSVVVVDEAHNITESINSIYSINLTKSQLLLTLHQLHSYKERYEKKFKASTLEWLNILITVVNKITVYITSIPLAASEINRIYSIIDFETECRIAGAPYWKLVDFIQQSELPKKLNGFNDKYCLEVKQHEQQGADYQTRNISVLGVIAEFFNSLKNKAADARILIQRNHQIKFLMLNPSVHLLDVLTSARSLILAGGTMQPFNHYISQLFPMVPQQRLFQFSCGHVVKAGNLLTLTLNKSILNNELRYNQQHKHKLIAETGRIVVNLVKVVPDGLVLFFPSKSYENEVLSEWSVVNHSSHKSILDEIQQKKKVFREGEESEKILAEYKEYIEDRKGARRLPHHSGAMISCVVNGKLSEGINFKDSLARCVVMVGLPYPDRSDEELLQKLQYLDSQGQGLGEQYYQSLCMRAVNQSIGRAVRHADDYAAILLLDVRYQTDNKIREALPMWLKECGQLIDLNHWAQVQKELMSFFKTKH